MIAMAKVCCNNPYLDYNEINARSYLDGDEFNKNLTEYANSVVDKLCTKVNEHIKYYDRQSDYSIYTGYSGIAYLHMWKYKRTKNMDSLEFAERLLNVAIANLKLKRISFLNGDAGPLALAIVLYSWKGQEKEADDLIDRLIKLPNIVVDFPDEILYGRAGYIYALLYVIKHVGRVIPVEEVRKHLEKLLRSGYKRAKKENFICPLKYEWHGKNYLGAAHGVAGILYMLLVNKHLLSEYELNSLIKPTLDWLVSIRFKSGNFPSSETNDRDRLVQWCHGAPGFVHLFTLASEVYEDEGYLKVARQCGEIVWNRGILVKGYSICHGVAGNAYTFSHLYKVTKDRKYLYRLACFLHWCTAYPQNEGMKPDRPNSLFEGMSGLAFFLMDSMDPARSLFPGYAL
ncbi:glutathione S-transferase LANCL1-like [Rhodnius prolixus]|uniref:Putative lanthionine synthetase c-like protein 1 n=2 Tax=Rhodnius TaxID=13248 RepID=A0A4P6D922_RHOPR